MGGRLGKEEGRGEPYDHRAGPSATWPTRVLSYLNTTTSADPGCCGLVCAGCISLVPGVSGICFGCCLDVCLSVVPEYQ